MTSGLQKIRRELGPEALILSTKTVRGSGFGIKGKPMLEITAAIDDLPVVNRNTPHSVHMAGNSGYPATSPAVRSTTAGGGRFRQVVDDNIEDLLHTAATDDSVGKPFFSHTVEQKRQTRSSADKKSGEPEQPAAELYEEVRQLKKLINGLSSQLQETISRKTPQKPPQQITTVLQQKQKRTHSPKNPLLRQILERGIEPETARTLTNFLEANYNKEELLDPHDVAAKLVEITRNLIEVAPPQFDNGDKQQRIAFVGPTGVGKTTTLAKVCAHYLATKSKSVALITIDTYRIAAVEQLKIYGEIMGLPVDVVFTPEQMKAALHRHKDKELVLIDTAGRSPRDPYNIDELSSFLNA
ncbi:flagellar biosynthesis protein FlhF, partial [candidate division KSB3 bacterium]